jgi:hypothetical protein
VLWVSVNIKAILWLTSFPNKHTSVASSTEPCDWPGGGHADPSLFVLISPLLSLSSSSFSHPPHISSTSLSLSHTHELPAKLLSGELPAKLLSGELLSNDLLSGELLSNDLISGELLSKDVLSGELLTNDGLFGELLSNDILSNNLHSDELLSNDLLSGGRPAAPFFLILKKNTRSASAKCATSRNKKIQFFFELQKNTHSARTRLLAAHGLVRYG